MIHFLSSVCANCFFTQSFLSSLRKQGATGLWGAGGQVKHPLGPVKTYHCFLWLACSLPPPALFIAPSRASLCAQANMWRKVLYVILGQTNKQFERLWSWACICSDSRNLGSLWLFDIANKLSRQQTPNGVVEWENNVGSCWWWWWWWWWWSWWWWWLLLWWWWCCWWWWWWWGWWWGWWCWG